MLKRNIELKGKTILITGIAGFIGSNLALSLFSVFEDVRIIGIDNMNTYYDVSLKKFRLDEVKTIMKKGQGEFIFIKGDIADKQLLFDIFSRYNPEVVVNLAAQAGVRYSITNPDVYLESNIIGFYNLLEACRYSYDGKRGGVKHLVYASSSSVYGNNKKIPYATEDKVDKPVSLYAATKKSNELFAYTYSKLYGIPTTGLRFFTVYGPAGRPDMAYFNFTDRLVNNKKIQIFNYGNCKRDFTYIDDIIDGVIKVLQCSPLSDEDGNKCKVYNIGNNKPENLLYFVDVLEQELRLAGILPEYYDLTDHKELVGMQPGDVETTYADITEFENDFGFRPSTSLRQGLRKFVQWYREYSKVIKSL